MRLAIIVMRLFDFYQILLVVACILTWIPRRPGSFFDDVATVIMSIADPWLSIFRRFIPPFGGMDFSPIVAIVALQIIERLVLNIL